ncbi:MAG: histidine-type phosphatase [Rudaea sp.]|uniref:histidine-type phosphatase n=1 Tax=Rudaea sp. TaxID=2136325 RepID=UPI0039E5AC8A
MKLIASCALAAVLPFSVQADGGDGLKLERVVMLMRHGVRSPTQAQVTPDGTADRPWPKWPVDYGELTPHGYAAVKLLGAWDRTNWAARGLLPAQGCPDARDIAVSASAKQRTQDTARALLEGMALGCNIGVTAPKSKKDDVEFHSLESAAVPFDAREALRAAQARMPAGGMEAEVRRHAELFALLNRALGCCSQAFCKADGKAKSCDISQMPAGLKGGEDGAPSIGEPFDVASTAAQTFLLEYLEGMPKQDVAWGRLGRADIERLLQFHSLKYVYEARTPYIAARGASLLMAHMLQAMENGPKLTVLAGHDTNIALLGGFLDLHWKIPSYPDDDPPPGGALGFEILSDAAGTRYVRAFYRVQTMDQIRELQPLDRKNAPDYVYLDIPGCAKRCLLDDFVKQVRAKLVAPAGNAGSNSGDISYSTKTPYAPQQDPATYQKPPAGFAPVLVEHVARHGSRAMTSAKSGDLSLRILGKGAGGRCAHAAG